MELKIGEMLGGVGEKIYLCITLSCTRQIESKLSLHSLAKCLHNKRLKGEDYGNNE